MARKRIDSLLGELNKLQGIPAAWYRDDAGNLKYRTGAYQLDYMQPGDATRCYQLERVSGPEGGVSCPLGYARMNARELEIGLEALLYAAKETQKTARALDTLLYAMALEGLYAGQLASEINAAEAALSEMGFQRPARKYDVSAVRG